MGTGESRIADRAGVAMPRRPSAKHFACIDCGASVGMPRSRCPTCRAAYKRAYRRAYLPRYHARTRTRPTPTPQEERGDLPPCGRLEVSDDGSQVQCHVCGRWYGGLSAHVRVHGLTTDAYKERYGLARRLSLWSPHYQARQRAAAIARGQPAVGRAVLREIGPGRNPGGSLRLSTRIAGSQARFGRRRPPPDASATP